MRRPLTPLWLATPSRFAGRSQTAARGALVVLVAALLATLAALAVPASQIDTAFYAGIVDSVRHGGNYYAVTADALRAGDYPLRPVLAFGLPTLAMVEAYLPSFAVTILLYALAVAVATAWHARLKAAVRTVRAQWLATLLLLFALLPMLKPALIVVPEVWAGLFVALSLAVRRPGRWFDAVGFALAAALIRETAVVYMLMMLAFAWSEGARRETIGWMVAIALVLAVFAAHVHAVAEVVKPLDATADPLALLGVGLAVEAAASGTMLAFLPLWIAALLVGLALFGWAAWDDATGLRVLALAIAVGALLALFGRADTPHWALLVAPLVLPGLVFAIDGLRDLWGAALDSRRITVRRILR
ncbi:hypothetical protein FSB78_03170 [Sphingomonas ginsenosidivorax]|uniref:DUF2029 domain-containing protein n=1 Tax=Sphingomonas ginsenosidivorax TaxID=862135 RepID=A0A5C6UBG0_9SPHN|nr:hypothetical protein [Sphingomonas ginsenosidivorax]TXC70062.1 hypothetical protein FSB78_03170 [Sphingomonas ginsenosidivorax]